MLLATFHGWKNTTYSFDILIQASTLSISLRIDYLVRTILRKQKSTHMLLNLRSYHIFSL